MSDHQSLQFYDTATATIRSFLPVVPGKVSIYLCGATVQASPHIGHLRSGIVFDILRRWLLEQRYDVRFVRNVTDIDDKILIKSAEAGCPWWEWAARYEREFNQAYDILGVLPASFEPRATGHITQMIELIDRLIQGGYAYSADGDVYFDVCRFSEYGKLSGQRLADVYQGESPSRGKKDLRDFTLWKAAKPGEPSWPTPWGRGRPGWHLECSAMAYTYLGSEFDIHCGGMDLIFPHHENEIAQSQGAGDRFARYWLHNGWVTLGGEKMSKSLGNVLSINSVLERVSPAELRYYLGSAHYRSMLEFSEAALQDAAQAYRGISTFLHRVKTQLGSVGYEQYTPGFSQALNNDLAVPKALAEIHRLRAEGNRALAEANDTYALWVAGSIRTMMKILGCDPLDPHWDDQRGSIRAVQIADRLISAEIKRRDCARAQKDWVVADQIRDNLAQMGITIVDTADGTQWLLTEDEN